MTNELKRRISFTVDSILTAVIQEADVTELVRILYEHADEIRVNQVNHVGVTALHHGVLSNNLDVVKLLLCNGADVNMQDVHGFSPLHTAATCGFTEMVSLLLLYGADAFLLTAQKEMPIDVAREISVIRLLSAEMQRHFQRELFLASFLCRTLSDLWLVCRRHAQRLTAQLKQLTMQAWKRYKTNEHKLD